MHTSSRVGQQPVGDLTSRIGRPRVLRRCLLDGVLIVGFYSTYALIRNMQGGRTSTFQETRALSHGLAVLGLEQRLGLDHEASIQSFFLRLPALMKAANIFYATAHFTVTAIVLFALTVAGGPHHSRWRNVLGLSTALALIGFALYPTMPPRLLPDHPALIDTLSEIGGFWSFETPAIERIADPYAAMPSLHLVWAAWVASAVWARLTRGWMKAVAITYPLLTLVVVVATANHYLLDVIAGFAVLSLAWLLLRPWTGRTPSPERAARRCGSGAAAETSAPTKNSNAPSSTLGRTGSSSPYGEPKAPPRLRHRNVRGRPATRKQRARPNEVWKDLAHWANTELRAS